MDRRIKYTKNIIKETFFDLLEKKEINHITVSEICQIADINRATFYRYYLDVYDLLDKIEYEFIEDLKAATKQGNEEQYTITSFAKQLLEIFIKNKQLVRILFNSKNTIRCLNDILEIAYYHCKKVWEYEFPNIKEEDIEYATVFIFNGALGIINFWIQNDFDKNIDEISLLITKLSYNGIKIFIYKK